MAKILVVDDSSSMRQMASFTLKGDGHDCTEASDGQEALELAQKEAFDVVLTDRNMPNLNGIELAKKLRELPNYKSVPILVLTTESTKDKKMEGKDAGVTGWIVKPFQPETLCKTIKRVV
ncbi:MAG: response regulator [Cellvibrionaceae bacterium]